MLYCHYTYSVEILLQGKKFELCYAIIDVAQGLDAETSLQ